MASSKREGCGRLVTSPDDKAQELELILQFREDWLQKIPRGPKVAEVCGTTAKLGVAGPERMHRCMGEHREGAVRREPHAG